MHLESKHSSSQTLQPSVLQIPVPQPVHSESTKVNHIPNFQIIIIQQFLHITLNPNSNKSEILVAEELDERVGEVSGVDELEDDAASTHAELESGNWVFDVAVETGSPLDVEADDEAVETAAVDAVDVGEPGVDHLGSVGDEGLDVVGVKSDFE